MGPRPQPVEGARHRRHQDPLPPDQAFLSNPDEKRPGHEGLCQPHHLAVDGDQTHERLGHSTGLDRHRLLRYASWMDLNLFLLCLKNQNNYLFFSLDGEGVVEQLAAKFKTAEIAESFKKTFLECQSHMGQTGEDGSGVVSPMSGVQEHSKETNPQVFLTVAADGQPLGTITIELFSNVVPKTAENFRALCTGEKGFGLRDSIFHRVIPDFMCQVMCAVVLLCHTGLDIEAAKFLIFPALTLSCFPLFYLFLFQGGDITNSDGTGGKSIYGSKFEDENFDVRHTGPGILSMANRGRDTNNSQFFITLKKAEHLDCKHVAFGWVRGGMDVLQQMGQLGTKGGPPTKRLVITDCGQL